MKSTAFDPHVHSTFSLLDGFGTPKQIVERAVELGWSTAAITEHGWLGSAPAFYKAAREANINPIIGVEFYVVPNEILGDNSKENRQGSFHLTVLALSAEGYKNLVAWTSFSHLRENFYHKPRISIEAMAELAPYPLHHNVVLSGCLGSELCTTLAESNGNLISGKLYVDAMKSLWPNFYIEIQDHRMEKFIGKGFTEYEAMIERETIVRAKLLDLADRTDTPIVIANDSHYQSAAQRKAHVAMKSAAWRNRDERHTGGGTERRIVEHLPNYIYFTSYMRDMERIADEIPGGNKALVNLSAIGQEAKIRLSPLDDFSYSIPFSGYEDPIEAIRHRCKPNVAALVGKHGISARERFERELAAMGDFAHYLLLMSDFLRYAHRQGILTNTRGSAANSLLCYCLGIHDVDSIEYGLIFERFFNPDRKKVPDIDIDIEKDRYEDFMAYVVERMTELEGEGQCIPICNLGTFANRSTFRLVAEGLGIDKDKIDEISKLLPQMIDSGMVEEENDVYEALKYEHPEIYELAAEIFDAIKNVSQHACGWVMGTKERPLSEWVPLYLIASSNTNVAQFNFKTVAEHGFVKGDFLRLRTLSVISRCRKLLGQSALDISDIPLDDPATFQMLREGKTEGVFTLQGKENRKGVMECEVEDVHGVIASVAIYRPALTRVGGHTIYNNRRKGLEEVPKLHPIVDEILAPTYGIPIFQEQILEIGYAIGMNHIEAQSLLDAIKEAKGVGRNAKEEFEKVKPVFFKRAVKALGKAAEAVWKFFTNFEGYGFNKGHATSYGRLAVRAAYLKCHYPAEYFTALLDVYPEKAKYIAAARAEGFHFIPPSVNESAHGFDLAGVNEIRVGLGRVKGFGPVARNAVVNNQPFASFEDFRSRVTKRQVDGPTAERLARLDFFSAIGIQGEDRSSERDLLEFQTLNLITGKPVVFQGVKPLYIRKGVTERGWVNAGRMRGVELTEYGSSVSKLFWIPPLPAKEIIKLEASSWARVQTFLLTAVDENGLPFHIMVGEDKKGRADILEFLARKFKNAVVSVEGAVRPPFKNDYPMGFTFYSVTGADHYRDPQIWDKGGIQNFNKNKLALVGYHDRRRNAA